MKTEKGWNKVEKDLEPMVGNLRPVEPLVVAWSKCVAGDV